MRRYIFQAISNPIRREVITLITLQAMTSNAITENFDAIRQAISKHLRILIERELVTQIQQVEKSVIRLNLNE